MQVPFSRSFFTFFSKHIPIKKKENLLLLSIYKDGAPAIEEVLIIVPSLCQEDEQNKTYKGRDKNNDGDDFLLFALNIFNHQEYINLCTPSD